MSLDPALVADSLGTRRRTIVILLYPQMQFLSHTMYEKGLQHSAHATDTMYDNDRA